MIDVIAEGFDAGIRYGGTVPEDMVAQPLSGEIAWVVVASPAYIRRHGSPQHPTDLNEHRCLGIRLGTGRIYEWEFDRGSESVQVAVPGAGRPEAPDRPHPRDEAAWAVGAWPRNPIAQGNYRLALAPDS